MLTHLFKYACRNYLGYQGQFVKTRVRAARRSWGSPSRTWCGPPASPRPRRSRPGRGDVRTVRKGTNRVSTNGVTANFMFCDRGTFGVLPLTYLIFTKVSGRTFFPNLSKGITFAAAPLVLTPFVRNKRVDGWLANLPSAFTQQFLGPPSPPLDEAPVASS